VIAQIVLVFASVMGILGLLAEARTPQEKRAVDERPAEPAQSHHGHCVPEGPALRGRVRRVEPSAFTKLSALGVEEQRVHVVGDLVDAVASLGDGYRVEARIVVWQETDILKVPSSALFRHGRDWNVFVVENSRAVRRLIQIEHRNAVEAEILKGLREGEVVVVHPSEQLDDGVRVQVR
jgi:HlyD family secretion protein